MESRLDWLLILMAIIIGMKILISSSAYRVNNTIMDTNGYIVKEGVEYYALSASKGSNTGGGLTVKNVKNNKLYVVQEKSEASRGLPVLFNPYYRKGSNEFEGSTFVYIAMLSRVISPSECNGSNLTLIKDGIAATSGRGHPFFIGKIAEDDYMLYYCPLIVGKGRGVGPACIAVGIQEDDAGNRWVVLQGASGALRVRFRKV